MRWSRPAKWLIQQNLAYIWMRSTIWANSARYPPHGETNEYIQQPVPLYTTAKGQYGKG